MKVSLFFPDGKVEELEMEIPVNPSYELIKSIVDRVVNGHWEAVTVLHDGIYTDMVIDEDGKRKNLPINEKATEVYRNNILVNWPNTDPHLLDYVVGGAVLFHEPISSEPADLSK